MKNWISRLFYKHLGHQCVECRVIRLPFWQRRCSFCDEGEGLVETPMDALTKISPDLLPYRVTFYEVAGDKHSMVFECLASDVDHSIEQVENAYPGCVVINSLYFEDAAMVYAIYSPTEAAVNDGAGFWSNSDGWTEFAGAERFSYMDSCNLNLPFSRGNDSRWFLWHQAKEEFDSVNRTLNQALAA